MIGDTYQRVWLGEGGSIWPSPTAPGTAAFGPMTEHKVVPADAIVIERGDDMTVRLITTISGAMYWKHSDGHDESDYRSADELEADARRLLARAEYLRTHPPVDEAEVERLAGVIAEIVRPGDKPGDGTQVEINSATLARRLYLAGVRAPEVTE